MYDAILVKDNHLAQRAAKIGTDIDPVEAVQAAREFLKAAPVEDGIADLPIEIEVDTLEQLDSVLPVGPDLVLLDNMTTEQLSRAVEMRDRQAPGVVLEASGGIRRETVRAFADTGVDRISLGALTHSARSIDIALDWDS